LSLEVKAKQILKNFEESSSEDILEFLNQIQNKFKSQITRNYLKGKLETISNIPVESEKKKLCKNLRPYFEWYLQGL
jgi:hypothetical protein